MFDMPRMLKRLRDEDKRQVFHSEADFQHSLAWTIHEEYPGAKIRLEYRPPNSDENIKVDIWVEIDSKQFAIELKYLTDEVSFKVKGEKYNLRSQSEGSTRRYDFINDIQRLEELQKTNPGLEGYAILLTNSPYYWDKNKYNEKRKPNDMNFRIHASSPLSGELAWVDNKKSAAKGREDSLNLKGTYKCEWKEYRVKDDNNNEIQFEYLLIRVKSSK